MKKLKLFCGILIGLMIFSSCSKEDALSPIIGTWKPVKDVEVCSTGSEEIYNFDSCEQTGRLIFNKDGNFSISAYYLSGNDCLFEYKDYGTWAITNGNLSIKEDGITEQVTYFELSGNTLRVGQYEDDPDYFCDGENLLSHYYMEFVRVE